MAAEPGPYCLPTQLKTSAPSGLRPDPSTWARVYLAVAEEGNRTRSRAGDAGISLWPGLAAHTLVLKASTSGRVTAVSIGSSIAGLMASNCRVRSLSRNDQ